MFVLGEHKGEGGSKVRLALFLFVPLMESGSKYSILKEENFLSGHPLLLNISPGRTGLYLVPMSPSGYVQG